MNEGYFWKKKRDKAILCTKHQTAKEQRQLEGFFLSAKKSVSKPQFFSPLWMFVWFNIPQVAGRVSHPMSWCLMRISLWFILRKILLWWETDVLFREPSPWHFRNSSMSVFMRLHKFIDGPSRDVVFLHLHGYSSVATWAMEVMVQKIRPEKSKTCMCSGQ